MNNVKVNKFLRAGFILRLAMRLGWRKAQELTAYRLCSQCFSDEGLRLSAEEIGLLDNSACPNCHAMNGQKLTKDLIKVLAHRYFVWGTLQRMNYGAAPLVQFNDRHKPDLEASTLWPETDMRLIEKTASVGFFHYGPRLWMIGENITPLDELISLATREETIQRIIREYPEIVLTKGRKFYRLRINPDQPEEFNQYDSPPVGRASYGRLDSENFPVMYASQDLQICIHECRVAAEDEIFVATLALTKDVRLLDLTAILPEPGRDEFESLDIAVHMLFFAKEHSYEVSRALALSAFKNGYDGLIYPSYFSLLKTGNFPFETTFGMSHRMIPKLAAQEKSKIIANLALFGRPMNQGVVKVQFINRLVLRRVHYNFHFGPVGI